jgi:hypothetical protein
MLVAWQSNITFSHAMVETDACFNSPCNGQSGDFLTTAAIHLEGARNWTLESLEISHVGGYAVWADVGCVNVVVVRRWGAASVFALTVARVAVRHCRGVVWCRCACRTGATCLTSVLAACVWARAAAACRATRGC